MTTLTTSTFPSALTPAKTRASLIAALSGLAASISASLRTRRNLRELESLSDDALKDIGLSRFDLPRVARWGH